jgi:hypothetical protein
MTRKRMKEFQFWPSINFVWVMIIVVLSSCTSLSELGLENYPNDELSKTNYSDLNGTYSNSHDTIFGELKHIPYNGFDELEQQTIISQLFIFIPESFYRGNYGEIIPPEEKWVSFEFISDKKANVSLYQNDSFIFSKEIHGKFKDGYFYLRPKWYIIPLVPFVFGYSFERARIGKSGTSLLIDYSVNMWGFAVFAGSSDKGYSSSVFEQKQ